jgi:2-(1,2-epoxy-1,2-dihydrophenyl)acetyl-CoA isomerase
MSNKVETGTQDLLADLTDGVLTLTMNRPEARNAMSGEMTAALAKQLEDAELNSGQSYCVDRSGQRLLRWW